MTEEQLLEEFKKRVIEPAMMVLFEKCYAPALDKMVFYETPERD
jgi:hypothetical protein